MKAIVLAAGYATRLYPLTENRPKALLPIAGKPLLEYLLDQIASIEAVDHIYIISNHRFAAQFEEWLREAGERYTLPIKILDDGTMSDADKLGALGDFSFVLKRENIDDDVMLAASDNFFTFDLRDFYADFAAHGRDTILTTQMLDEGLLRQMAVLKLDENQVVIEMEEKPEHPKSNTVAYAVYIYRRDTLPLLDTYLAEGNSPDAPGHFPSWLSKRQEVRAYSFSGECIDIGTPQNYADVNERFEKKMNAYASRWGFAPDPES